MIDSQHQISNYKKKLYGVAITVLLLVSVAPFSQLVQNVDAVVCTPPPPGIVSWWAGDGNAKDIAGNHDGTLLGGTAFLSGLVGDAFSFDGVDDNVKINSSPNLDVGRSNGLTIDAWIKPTSVSNQQPLVEYNSGGTATANLGVHLWIAVPAAGGGSGSLYANILDTSGNSHVISSPQNILTAGTFQHVALTYDKTTGVAKLYKDGQVVATQNVGPFTPKTGFDVYLSKRPNSLLYSGLMDEVQILLRPLASSEIQSIVNADRAGQCKEDQGPTGYTLQETKLVPVDGSSFSSSTTLAASGSAYKIKTSGEFFIGGPGYADAEYAFAHDSSGSHTQLQDNCEDASNVDIGVGIDDTTNDESKLPDWGNLQDTHIYTVDFQGKDAPIVVNYHDCGYSNNLGFLTLRIYKNTLPTANAGTDQTVNEGANVVLDGSGSADSDGTINSYSWNQTAGTTVTLSGANSASPSFTAPSVGSSGETLTFELKVTDNGGASATDTVNITVQNANQPPTANAGQNQIVNEGDTVTLDGSASSDADGTIESYLWEQTAGNPVTLSDTASASPTFTAPSVTTQTTLTFNLRVTDNDGGTASDTVDIVVNNVNQAPTANAGQDQTVNEGGTVTLDGSGSSDRDGTMASYSWIQTGGTSVTLSDASSKTPSFTTPNVDSAGDTLTFKLTVTDNDGATATDTVNVQVNNANQAPVAKITANPTTINGGDSSALDATTSSDSDGTITTYEFSQTAGTAGTITIDPNNSAKATFKAPSVSADETATIQVKVTDNDGATSTATIDILVKNISPPSTQYTIKGFYAPVDMKDANDNPIVNTIKSGKAVAMKFEVFDQNNVEQTSTNVIQSFKQNKISCGTLEGESDPIEITNTGGTTLRYDTGGGTFLQNWKTPSGQAGNCYSATVTTVDGSSITAYFQLK